MSPRPIIEDFNVIKGGAPGLCSCLKGLAINAFTFETVKEAFHGCIIVTISSTAHARHHALLHTNPQPGVRIVALALCG